LKTIFIMPIQNDYQSASILIEQISGHFRAEDENLILVVDDGSAKLQLVNGHELLSQKKVLFCFTQFKSGHQNAICFGLSHVKENYPGYNVVILDGDGEDKAADALSLAQRLDVMESPSVILAIRGTRDVGIKFRIGYFFFTHLFKKFTGKNLRSGNFMAISKDKIPSVLNFPGIRLHLAAAVTRYEPDVTYIEFNRGSRIAGNSRMNLASLTLHAYGAFSVFSDIVLARFCLFLFMVSVFLSTTVLVIIALKVTGILGGIPGWTSLVILQISATTVILLSIAFIGLMLQLRTGLNSQKSKV